MKRFHHSILPITLLFGLMCGSAFSQDSDLKTASVDMNKLVQEYHKTAELKKLIKVDREKVIAEIEKMTAEIRIFETDLAKIKTDMDNPSLDDERRKELFNTHQEKIQLGMQKDAERNEIAGRRQRAMTEKYQVELVELAKEIREVVQKYAVAESYEIVFDKTANSLNGGIPVMIYAKDATDITASILKEINKGAAAAVEEKPIDEK